jgi:hypothetical protein
MTAEGGMGDTEDLFFHNLGEGTGLLSERFHIRVLLGELQGELDIRFLRIPVLPPVSSKDTGEFPPGNADVLAEAENSLSSSSEPSRSERL